MQRFPIPRAESRCILCVIVVLAVLGRISCQLATEQDNFEESCCFIEQDVDLEQHTSTNVCCRAKNCSICDVPKAQFLLDDQKVEPSVEIHLEAYPAAELCPDGEVNEGILCVMPCWTETSYSTTIYHTVKSINLPCPSCTVTRTESCSECCVLSYSQNPNLPCDLGCQFESGEDVQFCPGQPCSFVEVPFTWRWMDTLLVRMAAPEGQMYTWTPSHDGVLIISILLRWEQHRRACCPPGVQTCCGKRRGVGQDVAEADVCSGPEQCAGGGSCVVNCDCPYGEESLYGGDDATSANCWTASGQKEGDECSMFYANYPITDDMVEFSHLSGWSNRERPTILASNGPSYLRVSGAGAVLEVHLGIRVQRRDAYSLGAVSFRPFTADTGRKQAMCPQTQQLMLKPSTMQFRSYVRELQPQRVPFSSLPRLENQARINMALEPTCEGLTNCSACAAFEFRDMRCLWLPHTRQCVVEQGPVNITGATRVCSKELPTLPAEGKDGVQLASGVAMAVILLSVGILSAVLYNLWLARATKPWDSIGCGLDQSGTLLAHEVRHEEARRGDARLLQELPVPRDARGNVPYVKEVMRARLKDPKCPAHLLDDETRTHHLRTHGVSCD